MSAALQLNRKPGKRMIVSHPRTIRELEQHKESDHKMMDFYLAPKSL